MQLEIFVHLEMLFWEQIAQLSQLSDGRNTMNHPVRPDLNQR